LWSNVYLRWGSQKVEFFWVRSRMLWIPDWDWIVSSSPTKFYSWMFSDQVNIRAISERQDKLASYQSIFRRIRNFFSVVQHESDHQRCLQKPKLYPKKLWYITKEETTWNYPIHPPHVAGFPIRKPHCPQILRRGHAPRGASRSPREDSVMPCDYVSSIRSQWGKDTFCVETHLWVREWWWGDLSLQIAKRWAGSSHWMGRLPIVVAITSHAKKCNTFWSAHSKVGTVLVDPVFQLQNFTTTSRRVWK